MISSPSFPFLIKEDRFSNNSVTVVPQLGDASPERLLADGRLSDDASVSVLGVVNWRSVRLAFIGVEK